MWLELEDRTAKYKEYINFYTRYRVAIRLGLQTNTAGAWLKPYILLHKRHRIWKSQKD